MPEQDRWSEIRRELMDLVEGYASKIVDLEADVAQLRGRAYPSPRPIDSDPPPDGTVVLMWAEVEGHNGGWFTGRRYQIDPPGAARLDGGPPTARWFVTHWLPLPAPVQSKGEE